MNDKYAVVLVTYAGDMIIPSIVIYDLNGKKIDEKNFMINWCDRDYDYLGLQYFFINADFTFSAIDTSYNFKMDSITQEIIDTIKTETSKIDYFININGKIIEK